MANEPQKKPVAQSQQKPGGLPPPATIKAVSLTVPPQTPAYAIVSKPLTDAEKARLLDKASPGRPTDKEMGEKPFVPVRTEIIMKPVEVMICLCCGRGMEPRVTRTNSAEGKRWLMCSLCGGGMMATYNSEDKAINYRRL